MFPNNSTFVCPPKVKYEIDICGGVICCYVFKICSNICGMDILKIWKSRIMLNRSVNMPVSHMSINILNMFSSHILLESVGGSVGCSVGGSGGRFSGPSGTIWCIRLWGQEHSKPCTISYLRHETPFQTICYALPQTIWPCAGGKRATSKVHTKSAKWTVSIHSKSSTE